MAVSKTALTTCVAGPKPARKKMTVTGEADAVPKPSTLFNVFNG